MKAVCWYGKDDVRVETVPDPKILNPRDAIIKVTLDGDLRLRPAPLRRLHPDDEARRHPRPRVHGRGGRGRPEQSRTLKVGDRVVVPFTIACGSCFFCKQRAVVAVRQLQPERLDGREALRLLAARACSATRTCYGGYAGGQAEYVRVPFADVGPIKVPDGLTDEQVLFLSDIFPTGYMAAENCDIQPGDTVAVWGCGPVGQFAIKSAYLLGAERVIAIDRVPGAAAHGARRTARPRRSTTSDVDVLEALRRADRRAAARTPASTRSASRRTARRSTRCYDRVKTATYLATDRPHALRQAIQPAARAARCRSPASTAASSTRSRSAPRSPRG